MIAEMWSRMGPSHEMHSRLPSIFAAICVRPLRPRSAMLEAYERGYYIMWDTTKSRRERVRRRAPRRMVGHRRGPLCASTPKREMLSFLLYTSVMRLFPGPY